MPAGVRLVVVLNLVVGLSYSITSTKKPLRWRSRDNLRALSSERAAVFRFPNKEFEKHLNTKIPHFASDEQRHCRQASIIIVAKNRTLLFIYFHCTAKKALLNHPHPPNPCFSCKTPKNYLFRLRNPHVSLFCLPPSLHVMFGRRRKSDLNRAKFAFNGDKSEIRPAKRRAAVCSDAFCSIVARYRGL
uniref:Secreted protein n=1 Tax=Bursaphelenchus xylophilus TaxID=6326 RepID=A0A1I7SA23_BURXY